MKMNFPTHEELLKKCSPGSDKASLDALSSEPDPSSQAFEASRVGFPRDQGKPIWTVLRVLMGFGQRIQKKRG